MIMECDCNGNPVSMPQYSIIKHHMHNIILSGITALQDWFPISPFSNGHAEIKELQ